MSEVRDYVAGLLVGDVGINGNIAVAQLFLEKGGVRSPLEYLTFDESVQKGLDIGETGHVPELLLENRTGKDVLIMQGELVKGGRQNRMLSRNLYVKKGFSGRVPVKCVEAHRWHGQESGFGSGYSMALGAVRSAKDQGEVWATVDSIMAEADVSSRTSDLNELYAKRNQDIEDKLKGFRYEKGAVGIVVAINLPDGVVYGAEIFDQQNTMEKNFEKLLRSYCAESLISEGEIEIGQKDLALFLSGIHRAEFRELPNEFGVAREYNLNSPEMQGTALEFKGIPVYVSLNNRKKDFRGFDEDDVAPPVASDGLETLGFLDI